jgi:Bacteriophage lambda head decoration protein D
MPSNDSYEFDYVPGYAKPTHEYGTPYGDEFHAEAVEELLFSVSAGYSQRGVTLAGGQGVLPTGSVLARHTASGYYMLYQAGATDGRATAIGVLRDSRDTGGAGGSSTTLAGNNGATITLTGTATTYSASPSGKAATPCQGNLVYRGTLNANLVSGTDTSSIVSGTGGGVASLTMTALGARMVPFGAPLAGAAFPGGPMDGDPGSTTGVNAFVF